MKARYLYSFAFGVVILAGIFGRIKRNTYTDFLKEENYMEGTMVAELPEEIAINAFSEMIDQLPKSPIILRVLVTGDIEFTFKDGRQKVTVQEIYAGNDLEIGQEIYLNDKSLIVEEGINYAELNFVNLMQQGEEYLVFMSHKVETLNEPIPIYQFKRDFFITPVFSYKEAETRNIVPVGEEDTYVPYIKVKDNEFFGESIETFEAWEDLKTKMLLAFPIT